ncbi:MAG: Fe-S cluster assembly protein SufD [Actinomycetota bacterium]|nr:Fe-S cluster assembly protein SufD [Actinomycetota bacterium]
MSQQITPEAVGAAAVLSPQTGGFSGRPHSHGATPVAGDSRGERFAAYDVADFDVPTGREEEWRFTPLDRIHGLHEDAGAGDGTVLVHVDAAPEVQVETVGRDDERLGKAGTPADRVAARAWSNFEKATVITVPTEQVASRPTMLRLRGEGGTAFGHVLVDVKPFAQAVVVLDHSGSATYADNVEFLVGDSASLTVVSVNDWADDAVHLSQQSIKVGRDARFKSIVVTFGGAVVRIAPEAAFAAPGGDLEMLGLYFADSGQHLEHRLFVDHAVPHCRSNVTYKGALQGEDAHTVWIGDVLIRAVAQGTETFELNRNLVLTDGARADSVPNLEIETGEIVGAGHASATGRFDDEQLFYLQSRGIPADEARRLVVRGFFADVIAQIGIPDIQERLLTAVEAELEGAVR